MAPRERKSNKPVIGLAGGIGAGKSTVAHILESLGVAVIDSDRLGHEVLNDPEVVESLRDWWGDGVVGADGGVDRGFIGDIVFEDPAQLSRLEGLLYPRIERRRDVLLAGFNACDKVLAIVIDAPKLYEAGVDRICDFVWFVDAGLPERLRRVTATRGWTKADLLRREKMQNPLDMKKSNADLVIENSFSIERLELQVKAALDSALTLFPPSSSGSHPESS